MKVSLLLTATGILSTIATSVRGQCTEHWLPGEGTPGPNRQDYCTASWDPDGPGPERTHIAASGFFESSGTNNSWSIGVWDGTRWIDIPRSDGIPLALKFLRNGDLIVGGGYVYSMSTASNGNLVAAGQFRTAGGLLSMCLAQWSTRPNCPGAFNCSGSIEVQDIFEYLAEWFAGDPRGDFNGVNGSTIADMFDFLAALFIGCP